MVCAHQECRRSPSMQSSQCSDSDGIAPTCVRAATAACVRYLFAVQCHRGERGCMHAKKPSRGRFSLLAC
eukprot:1398283-Pleurochrysis_carterae.AAC.2